MNLLKNVIKYNFFINANNSIYVTVKHNISKYLTIEHDDYEIYEDCMCKKIDNKIYSIYDIQVCYPQDIYFPQYNKLHANYFCNEIFQSTVIVAHITRKWSMYDNRCWHNNLIEGYEG